jgi:uncharacterized integral membrane protein
VVGIILLIFILQNMDNVRLHLLFWHFTLPLGVAVLLTAICGALITAVAGGYLMWQRRRRVTAAR